jgi:hypothetical protein
MKSSTVPFDISPYPSLKKTVSSHMPALLQYAEVETLLKKVQATSKRLENNIDTVLKARQDVDLLVGQSADDNRLFHLTSLRCWFDLLSNFDSWTVQILV